MPQVGRDTHVSRTHSVAVRAALVLLMLVLAPLASYAAGVEARACGAYLNLPALGIVDHIICDTGWLPPTGGSILQTANYAGVPGVFEFTDMAAESHDDDDCDDPDDYSAVLATEVVIFPGQAGEVRYSSSSSHDDDDCCNPDDDDFTAASFVDLVIEGVPVTVTGQPNQTVTTSVGTVVINEMLHTHSDDDCDDDAITLNAVHVYLQNGGQVIVGSVHHDDDEDCCSTRERKSSWGKLKSHYR